MRSMQISPLTSTHPTSSTPAGVSSVGLFPIPIHTMRRFQSLHEYVLVLIQGQAMLDEHFALCRAIQAYVTC